MGRILRAVVLGMLATQGIRAQAPDRPAPPRPYRGGVDLITLNVSVTDRQQRFVTDLGKQDFTVLEDGRPQAVSFFAYSGVPLTVAIVLDTSGSMEGEKMLAAKQALQRFLFELLGDEDEVFLYRFDNRPELVQAWTRDKDQIATELRRIRPRGATTLYDAVAEAIPLAQAD